MKDAHKEIQNCRAMLKQLFPNAALRLFRSQGGILVEVVSTAVDPSRSNEEHRKVFKEMIERNGTVDLEDRFVIHRLFTYREEKDRFRVGALLHTRAADYESGVFTSYLSAGDAKVWMTDLDSEALLFGVAEPFTFDVWSDLSVDQPFAVHDRHSYVEIAFHGEHRHIRSFKKKSPGFWTVEIA